MSNDFTDYLFPDGLPVNASASGSHPWLSAPPGFALEYDPACEACNLWQDHAVPYRCRVSGGTIPDTMRTPGWDWFQRLVDLLETLWWIGAGTGDVGFNNAGEGNPFTTPLPYTATGTEYPLVISASGQSITVESDFDPTNVPMQQRVQNPLWVGPGGDVPRIFFRTEYTALQANDIVGLIGSPLQSRVQCRIKTPPTGTVPGSERAYRWSFAVDQDVDGADVPLEHPDTPGLFLTPTVGFGRFYFLPPQWHEAPRPGPQLVTRRLLGLLTKSAAEALPDGELLLRDSRNNPTTIPYPVADDLANRKLGTVRVVRFRLSDPYVREDITAQTIAEGRWRNVHDGSLDEAYFSAGGTINGVSGYAPLHTLADHVLEIQYEAKANAADPSAFRRTTGTGTCKHSRTLPNGANYCGLASLGTPDFANNEMVPTPPSGLATFRADSAGGCRQWQTGVVSGPGTCDRFERRNAYTPHNHFANLLAAAWWGVPQYVEQSLNVLLPDITFRPADPSGVPGLVQMLGLPLNTPAVPGFQAHSFSGSAWAQFDDDDEGRPRAWTGAHYRLSKELPAPTVEWDDDGTWQDGGVLPVAVVYDGLGRPLDDDTDHGEGMRRARPATMPAAVDCYRGTIATPPLSGPHKQHVQPDRRFASPRVSLALQLDGGGAPVLQRPDSALPVRVLESTTTPGEPGDITLQLQTFGGWNGSAVNPKASAAIVSAAVDGSLVKLELERELRTISFALESEPTLGVSGARAMGGNVVKRAARFQPRDKADPELCYLGANPLRGAFPGDVARVFGVSTGDPTTDAAFALIGFFVDKGLAHGGASQTPDFPTTWQTPALDVPFERGDVVWLRDQHGLLAGNLGDLVGATLNIATTGMMSPLRDPIATVQYAVRDPASGLAVVDWTTIPAESLFIAAAEGIAIVDETFADTLRASHPDKEFCFQVTCDFLSREMRVDARAQIEVVDALNAGFQKLQVIAGPGGLSGILSVQQYLDGRSLQYGLQHNDIKKWKDPATAGIFDQTWTVGDPGLDWDPDLTPTNDPYFDQCVEGNWVHGLGEGSFSVPPPEQANGGYYILDAFMNRPFTGELSPRNTIPFAEIKWGGGIGFTLGPLARLPKGSAITSARLSARWSGVATIDRTIRVYANEPGIGLPAFSREVVEETVTEGTGSMRLAVATLTYDPDRNLRFPQIIAVSGAVDVTNDEWAEYDVTQLLNEFVTNFRSGNYQNLFIVGLGPGPDPDDNADTALLGLLSANAPALNVAPYLSACTGDAPFHHPVDNPDYFTDIDFEYETFGASWSGLEVWPTMEVAVSLPSDPTAGVGRPLNADLRHSVARPFPE